MSSHYGGITVGAVRNTGKKSIYSEECPALMVVTPAGSAIVGEEFRGLITTSYFNASGSTVRNPNSFL